MATLKKQVSGILWWFKRIALWVLSFFFYIFMIWFCFMTFEIPVPLLSDAVSSIIKKTYPQYFTEGQSIQIGSIAFSYNLELKKPLILIKNITYGTQTSSIFLDKIGIYPSLLSIIKERQFYLRKLFISGDKIILSENETGYLFEISKFDKNTNNSSNITTVVKYKSYTNKDYYSFLKEVKKSIDVLSQLDEISLDNSYIVLNSLNQKNINLHINNVQIIDKAFFSINIVANLFFNNNEDQNAVMSSNLQLDSTNILSGRLNINKISSQETINYFLPIVSNNKLSNNLTLDTLLDINMAYNHNLKSNDQNISMNISSDSGTLAYSSVIQPVKFNKIKTNLQYTNINNIIVMDNFQIDFKEGSLIKNVELGLKTNISRLEGNLKYNVNNHQLNIYNSIVQIDKNKSSINVKVVEDSGTLTTDLVIDSYDVSAQDIKKNWPTNLYKPLRQWVVKNVNEGHVSSSILQASLVKNQDKPIKLKHINGRVNIDNINVTYLDGLPSALSKDVVLDYDELEFKISYKNARSGKINSNKGLIKFYNSSDNPSQANENMQINLELNGNIRNTLDFLNNQPFNYVDKYKLPINNLLGDVSGGLDLLFDFKLSKILKMDLRAEIVNSTYSNAFNGIPMHDFKGIIKANLDELTLVGSGRYLESDLNINVLYNWYDPENIIQRYSLISNNFISGNLKYMKIIPDFLSKDMTGLMSINLIGNKVGEQHIINYNVDMQDSDIKLEMFNYSKNQGDDFSSRGIIYYNNDNSIGINNITVISDDFNVDMGGYIKGDYHKIQFNSLKIKNKIDLYGIVIQSSNNLSANLNINYIDVSYWLQSTDKDISLSDNVDYHADIIKKDSSDFKNYNIIVKANKVQNGKFMLNDLSMDLNVVEDKLHSMHINTYIRSKNKSAVVYEEDTSILGLNIYNVGYLLKFLNFSKEVENGSLESNISLSRYVDKKGESHMSSSGYLYMSDFSVGVPFSSGIISFKEKDWIFDINTLSLNGNFMGGEMTGYFDYNKKYLSLDGYFIPIWGANSIISNLPIIRTLINNQDGKNKLVQLKFYVKGPLKQLKYSFFNSNTNESKQIQEVK